MSSAAPSSRFLQESSLSPPPQGAPNIPPGRETPDLDSSTDAYAARFAGPAGRYLLDVQTRAVLRLLEPFRGATVLDVGGGHAQLALPLAGRGHRVTIVGSHPDCARRPMALLGPGRFAFISADLIDLPLAPRSYDVVACFRILPHVSDWRKLLVSLCRVARRAVLVDYPIPSGFNALAPALFGLKKRYEGNTRLYTTIPRRDLLATLRAEGFSSTRSYPQFFFPMVVHRAVKRPALSRTLEALPRGVGLTALWGSPVITLARRDGPDHPNAAAGTDPL